MSRNPLAQLGAFLTPPPVQLSPEYDGLEFRWKIFSFRPALFKNELFLLAGLLFYVAFYFIGKRVNEKRANAWFDSHLLFYGTQFSKPVQPGGLTQDGNSDFFAFSTGRRAVRSLHTTFTLRPRHDLFQMVYQFIWGLVELNYKVADEVELEFTLRDNPNVPECVWAVVAKDELKTIRNTRWDLSFTKTTENPNLPSTLSVMSEFADITETLFKTHGPLSFPKVLSDPSIQPYFRSLSITDQPRTRPLVLIPTHERQKRVILSLTLPPPSSAVVTLPLIQSVFQLVDVISAEGGWGIGKGPGGAKGTGIGLSSSLRPETRTKLKKAREDLDRLLKEEAEKEKKEEAAEEKAAAKKKSEEERLSKLSAAEQKKALEREKKRAIRKSQGKVKTR